MCRSLDVIVLVRHAANDADRNRALDQLTDLIQVREMERCIPLKGCIQRAQREA